MRFLLAPDLCGPRVARHRIALSIVCGHSFSGWISAQRLIRARRRIVRFWIAACSPLRKRGNSAAR